MCSTIPVQIKIAHRVGVLKINLCGILENNFFSLSDAVERLHSIVKSETAWDPAYSSVDGADDTRVPECTEGFMVLIKGIEGW